MSLIFGINLSDRIYVASDTRVTYNNKGTEIYEDSVDKTAVLSDEVVCVAAGSIKLSTYLYKELKKEKFVKKGINSIKDNIKPWAAKKIDEYLMSNDYSRACLIIAGIDKSRKKIINGKELIELVKTHQTLSEEKLFLKDALLKGVSSKPNQPNPNPELPVSDSTVISLLSDAKNNKLEVEEAKWGQYLAYGPKGFSQSDVPKTIFGQLEFEDGNDFKNANILITLIKSTAGAKKLGSVGGSVVVNMINDNGISLITTTVYKRNDVTKDVSVASHTEIFEGKLKALTETGEMVELVEFHNYKCNERSSTI